MPPSFASPLALTSESPSWNKWQGSLMKQALRQVGRFFAMLTSVVASRSSCLRRKTMLPLQHAERRKLSGYLRWALDTIVSSLLTDRMGRRKGYTSRSTSRGQMCAAIGRRRSFNGSLIRSLRRKKYMQQKPRDLHWVGDRFNFAKKEPAISWTLDRCPDVRI